MRFKKFRQIIYEALDQSEVVQSVRPKDKRASYIDDDPAVVLRNVLLYFLVRDQWPSVFWQCTCCIAMQRCLSVQCIRARNELIRVSETVFGE